MTKAIRVIKVEGDWQTINDRFDKAYDRSEYYAQEDYRCARIRKTRSGALIKVDARDYSEIISAVCWGRVRCVK